MFQHLYHILFKNTNEYVIFGRFIFDELGGDKIVGVNCFSYSLIKKNDCMKRVNDVIERLELPVSLVDVNEFNNHFKILVR